MDHHGQQQQQHHQKKQHSTIVVFKLAVHTQKNKLQVSDRVSSCEFVLQQAFYPVMATVIKETHQRSGSFSLTLPCVVSLMVTLGLKSMNNDT